MKQKIHHFVTNLFVTTDALFYNNWLSFVEDITKLEALRAKASTKAGHLVYIQVQY